MDIKGIKVDTEEIRKKFREEVRKVGQEEGLSFLIALYRVLDEWTARAMKEEKIQLACHAGCDFCCHQLVTATQIEWEVMENYIRSLPARQSYTLKKRVKSMRAEWQRYWQVNREQINLGLKVPRDDWQGKPCPFLGSDGRCEIYPVRTIDCRTMSSTIICTDWKDELGVERCRFPGELEANNWILEEEAAQGRTDVRFLMDLLLNSPYLL